MTGEDPGSPAGILVPCLPSAASQQPLASLVLEGAARSPLGDTDAAIYACHDTKRLHLSLVDLQRVGATRVILAWEGGRRFVSVDSEGRQFVHPAGRFSSGRAAAGLESDSKLTGEETWAAYLVLPLAGLGGYAREVEATISVADAAGQQRTVWPSSPADAEPPVSGVIGLAPLPRPGTRSGSLFVDGQGGCGVAPGMALDPTQITIEAWVRDAGAVGGTLVSTSRASSYCLSIRDHVEFSTGGEQTTIRGTRPLGAGWHHVAATLDPQGTSTIVVDGILDVKFTRQLKRDRLVTHPDGALDLRPLRRQESLVVRLGADPDPSTQSFHGYLRDVRIWDHARSVGELRATAFGFDEPLVDGAAPAGAPTQLDGLISRWLFVDGLQDRLGGPAVGLIGQASLARESLALSEFAPPPDAAPVADTSSVRPASDAAARVDDQAVVVLGAAIDPSTWRAAIRLHLEPDHHTFLRLLLTPHSLFLAISELTSDRALTVYLGSGSAGDAPAGQDLRLVVQADGSLAAARGDGERFQAVQEPEVRSVVTHVPAVDPEQLPERWSAQLGVPLSSLFPFEPDGELRAGVSASPTGDPDGPEDPDRLRWPARLVGPRPDSWGVVSTGPSEAMADAPEEL